MRRSIGFIALLAAVVAASASAQPLVLTGRVLADDGTPLAGATVVVLADDGRVVARAATGDGGVFRLSSPGGGVSIAAELAGFQPGAAALPPTSGPITLTLTRAAFHDAVQVVGEGPHAALEAAELREHGARDVGDALVTLPGAARVRRGPIAADVALRGQHSDNLNVLIDGTRVYGACPNRMDPPAFHVDLAEVERVEAVAGPFDVRNAGSLGGLVNVVTRRPEPGLHGAVSLAGGSDRYLNPSLSLGYGAERVSVLAGLSYRAGEPYEDGEGRSVTQGAGYLASAAGDAFRVRTGWVRLAVVPRPGQTLQVAASRQEADDLLYPALAMDAVYDDTDRLELGWAVERPGRRLSLLRAKLYGTRVRHDMTDERRASGAAAPRSFSMATSAATEVVGLRVEATLGRLAVGAEMFRREWDASTRLARVGYAAQHAVPGVATEVVGMFAEHERPLGSRGTLRLGARVDASRMAADGELANVGLYRAYHGTPRLSVTDVEPGVSARLAWRLAPGLEAVASLGSAARSPDARERYFALERMGTDWVGNPGLEPTRHTGLELGLAHSGGRGALELKGFAGRFDDWITVAGARRLEPRPGANTGARSYENVDARLWGGELSASLALGDRLFVSGVAAALRGSKERAPEKNVRSTNVAELPSLSGRVALRYDTGQAFAALEWAGAAAQDRVDSDLQELPTAGYGIVNLTAGGTALGVRVVVSVRNVLDRHYFEHFSSLRDPYRSGLRIPEPGRTFAVELSRRF